jgi:DNA-binding NtrC family response regulator
MNEQADVFLIVDDEPDMCWALEHICKKNGLASMKAFTGHEAIELMEGNCFSLAFLDAKLPDIEGIELARQIRRRDPNVRILMISGYFYRDDDAVQKALTEGLINGFIGKPFDHDEILKAIETTRIPKKNRPSH